jgi:hypothetical protein
MTVVEIDQKLQELQREIKNLMMAGNLDQNISEMLDMWETLGDIDALLRAWDVDSKETQRKLIYEEMRDDV